MDEIELIKGKIQKQMIKNNNLTTDRSSIKNSLISQKQQRLILIRELLTELNIHLNDLLDNEIIYDKR